MTSNTIAGLDLPATTAFLRRRGLIGDDDLSAELVGGGKSNLTFLLHSTEGSFVLRRPPLGTVQRGTHDVLRESRLQRHLSGSAIPVPEVVAEDPEGRVLGVPCYVMRAVDGVVIRHREDAGRLSPDVRHRLSDSLVDRLADLHQIDPTSVGLADLGRPDGYLARQVDRWLRQFDAIAVRDLPAVDRVGRHLRATVPVSPPPTIVHGDYRLDNVMVDEVSPHHIVAVLDWEMATIGDPLADLATLLMFWDEEGSSFNPITGGLMAWPGFASRPEALARYAERRGLGDVALSWYEAFATFRLAVILEQLHSRHVAGTTVGEGFDGLDQMVDQLLAESCAHLGLGATTGDPR